MLPSDGDRTGTVIAASVVFWFLGAVAVSLRFYARAKIVRVLGAEDWSMLGSLVSFGPVGKLLVGRSW